LPICVVPPHARKIQTALFDSEKFGLKPLPHWEQAVQSFVDSHERTIDAQN
jgi:hypothetical protein